MDRSLGVKDTEELLDFEIYPNLNRAEAVKDLNPQDKGKYYLLTCPKCGKPETYLFKTGIYIKCSRLNKCGYAQSLWDYIQNRKGLTNQETLRELARLAGYTLPEIEGYSEEKAEKARERANILEVALEYFKAQLWRTERGKGAINYLKGRGYSEEEIKGMELGFYPSQKQLESYIINRVSTVSIVNTLNTFGLTGKDKRLGNTHRVVIPYRDPVGRLKGFIVRTLVKAEPRYLFTYGVENDTLFNLHEARGQDTLILVEGFFDALIATERGLKGVVGIGLASLTATQLDNALRCRVQSFVLALDNDEEGQKETERALDLINRKGLKASVVTLPEGYKNPDEVINGNKEKGLPALKIEAFRELVGNPESAVRWKARRLLSKQSKKGEHNTDRVRG
jgi:DNA primase